MRFAILIALTALTTSAFYVPGVDPIPHAEGADINVRVNSLRSVTQLVPYDYYKLPFCRPRTLLQREESLGEIMFGDKMMSSLYNVQMKKDRSCVVVDCAATNDAEVKANADLLEVFINQEYRAGMSIDNLPGFDNNTKIFSGQCTNLPAGKRETNGYVRGYAVGVPKWCTTKTLLNNHLDFVVKYHQPDETKANFTVVGFNIRPRSINWVNPNNCDESFDGGAKQAISIEDIRAGSKVVWTYSVKWVYEPNIRWASRWDAYLHSSDADTQDRIHWFYILNSMASAMLIGFLVLLSLTRALKLDIVRYNSRDPEDQAEEFGWKLVSADIFRTPRYPSFLSMAAGNGIQLLAMLAVSIAVGCMGFLSPANRGSLMTATILFFVILSLASGYVCASFLKFFDRKAWKTIVATGCVFPGAVVIIYVIMDAVSVGLGASNAVDAGTLATIFGLWLGISIPLVVLGASFAFHQDTFSLPVNVGKLPREIPTIVWYFQPRVTVSVAPLVPLISTLVELRYILQSVWQGMVYYVFGFLALMFIIWACLCVLVTIYVVYHQITREDYRWWWRSFALPGGWGVHFMLYCVLYYFTDMDIQSRSGVFLYFAYMGLVSIAYGLAAGTIGFVSSFYFLRYIYGSIKMD